MATRISHTTQIFQATAEGEEYIKIKISHTLPLTTDLKEEPKEITPHPSVQEQHPPGSEKQSSSSSTASLWHSAKCCKAGVKVQ